MDSLREKAAALAAALRNWGRKGNVDERAAEAREASQQIADRLPEALMPNKALEEAKRRRAMIDAIRGD